MQPDIEELRRLADLHGLSERPWELSEMEGFAYSIFGRHPGEDYGENDLPCRITTGTDFDEIESARLAVKAVNALPWLLDQIRKESS